MQILRSILFSLLFFSQSAATAAAGQLDGEGRLATRREAQDIVDRYGSLPGDGAVRAEGRLISSGEAADVVRRYGSIPGRGVVIGDGRLITTAEAKDVFSHYKSIPGGLVLEGNARGLEWVRAARYEPASNAFVLNDRVTYYSPISPLGAAILVRAIAQDDRIGVSLTEDAYIAYGKLHNRSEAAADLRLADGFLGDLVLPPRDWTIGYRLAQGFVPREDIGRVNVTAFFRFRDFQFATKETQLEFERASLDVRVVPVLQQQAADGGYLPDLKAISRGYGFEAYTTNAEHVGANISYYLQEQIVARALAYGEAAAFFRGLKASGIDLRVLGRSIEAASGKSPIRPSAAGRLNNDWMGYLKEIQTAKVYGNWSAPPYDLYVDRKRGGPTKSALAPASK